jgi:hypothetical protein
MTLPSFLTKGLALAAASGSKFWSKFGQPTCTETIANYTEEISWVSGAIDDELAYNDRLLSQIWKAEL